MSWEEKKREARKWMHNSLNLASYDYPHQITDLIQSGDNALEAKDKEIARLREALAFYSSESSWAPHPEYENACCLDSADYGKVARDALKEEE